MLGDVTPSPWCFRPTGAEPEALLRRLKSRLGQQRRDRYDQDLDVESNRPVLRVKRIAGHTLVIRRRASAADLPQARDSGPAREISAHGGRIPLQFFVRYRPRSYDAHVASEDIEQLR